MKRLIVNCMATLTMLNIQQRQRQGKATYIINARYKQTVIARTLNSS